MSASLSRAVAMTRDLVRCPSVTPVEGGALALIETWLKPYGLPEFPGDASGSRRWNGESSAASSRFPAATVPEADDKTGK